MKTMSHLQPDAVVVGNHEFDEGLANYANQIANHSTFPIVGANYLMEPNNPLRHYIKPVSIRNVDGLRVGFIGVANFSSLSSITDVGNSLQIIPLDIVETVQEWIDFLRPQVDLIVAVSHAGLHVDEELIQRTKGLDLVFGGHLHVVLSPPKVLQDASDPPRDVVLTHSGAFAKYVGRLDVVVRKGEVVNHKYEIFPIDSTVPEDPLMLDILEPYRLGLNQVLDLTTVYGYASKHIRRFDFNGGDSPLGNLVAEALRKHAWADFGLTNSLGIRTDIFPGPITLDDLYNVFPFNNSITTLYLSGNDIQDLLSYVTRRSAGRGCATQVQVSGIEFTMNCTFPENPEECEPNCPPRAENIYLTNCGDPDVENKELCTKTPLEPYKMYEMATNDYIAKGGSGFTVLKINNTQVDTGVALRDAVLEAIVRSPACIEECRQEDGSLALNNCFTYQQCVEAMVNYHGQYCEHLHETTHDHDLTLPSKCGVDGAACSSHGDCYRLDVACADGKCTPCSWSGDCSGSEECYQGFCVKPEFMCVESRCVRRCKVDAHCRTSADIPESQSRCVFDTPDPEMGRCLPLAGSPCLEDVECIDVEAACDGQENAPGATCGECSDTNQCPSDHLCAGGKCVVVGAVCDTNRCRIACSSDDMCHPGHLCDAGRCIPSECLTPGSAEEVCLLENIYKASAECLQLPCPRAASDGRINRILPANLDELPEDINPDDPEG